ncbi:unnamed protein product [Vitrella brassicaformis CCMP3155]|uniref:Uncharacterized protein n=1 Tax=Vitrella brassicaformis (strain CCMP3155) TaxID=1169540 RepID=A0A0G4EB14_VITBC|nr:unnamed protein product [Vitrella brassicaformis CCMP3155]|eukprot:CEL92665.1 unnamed protein product [Vitrella brassicaformis CCMP3155]
MLLGDLLPSWMILSVWLPTATSFILPASPSVHERLTSPRTSLLSAVATPPAPPPTVTEKRHGGGGDGLRVLSQEEALSATERWLQVLTIGSSLSDTDDGSGAGGRGAVTSDEVDVLVRMRQWAGSLEAMHRNRRCVGWFCSHRLRAIGCLHIGRSSSINTMKLIYMALNPTFPGERDRAALDLLREIRELGKENAMIVDLTALKDFPSLMKFWLDGSFTTLDIEPVTNDPRVVRHKALLRSPTLTIDGPWPDLPFYWFQSECDDGCAFYFRRRFRSNTEFEVLFEPPRVGVSMTGSGTVGGALIVPLIPSPSNKQDVSIPGNVSMGRGQLSAVCAIRRRLKERLDTMMQQGEGGQGQRHGRGEGPDSDLFENENFQGMP